MAEEKQIAGFENYTIEVDGTVRSIERLVIRSNGRLYRHKEKVVKHHLNKSVGRYQVYLKNECGEQKALYLHRLLAIAFIPNPLNLPEVNHINGDKTDNRLENLEWCTRLENTQHAERLGLKNHKSGEENGNAKLTGLQVSEIRMLINDGVRKTEISERYRISLTHVYFIHHNKSWQTNG